ncbi:MAG: CoA transferase [Chloroflexi bacterium]|nr:CoA transferase [Chloroflexota bacterium]
MLKLPLEGFRVLELAEAWAGPLGGSLLGDLGAQVIKVEAFTRYTVTRVPRAGPGRGFVGNDVTAPRPWDRYATHDMVNRNKYGIALDLRRPRGRDVLNELIKISDVLTESFSAGTAEKLGIGYPAAKGLRPDIIMVSMPGFGVSGPYKGYVSLGSTLDAFTGHHWLRGYPDSDPTVTPVAQHTDAVGAVSLAFSVLAALHYRNRTGKGQWIDLSQVEAFLPHLARPLMDYQMNGRLPRPMGNADPAAAPHGCYRCRGEDNWVVIAVTSEEEWQALCHSLGHPEWTSDVRFSTQEVRLRYREELDALIAQWTAQRDKREVMHLLQSAGVPAQAVFDDADLYEDPHLAARGFFTKMSHTLTGEHRYPGPLWRLTGSRTPPAVAPNCLGEHNELVLGTILGMSRREVQELREEGVVGDTFR